VSEVPYISLVISLMGPLKIFIQALFHPSSSYNSVSGRHYVFSTAGLVMVQGCS